MSSRGESMRLTPGVTRFGGSSAQWPLPGTQILVVKSDLTQPEERPRFREVRATKTRCTALHGVDVDCARPRRGRHAARSAPSAAEFRGRSGPALRPGRNRACGRRCDLDLPSLQCQFLIGSRFADYRSSVPRRDGSTSMLRSASCTVAAPGGVETDDFISRAEAAQGCRPRSSKAQTLVLGVRGAFVGHISRRSVAEELQRRYAQGVCQLPHSVQRHVPAAVLHMADVRPLQTGYPSEVLLRKPRVLSQRPQRCTERSALRELEIWIWHARNGTSTRPVRRRTI